MQAAADRRNFLAVVARLLGEGYFLIRQPTKRSDESSTEKNNDSDTNRNDPVSFADSDDIDSTKTDDAISMMLDWCNNTESCLQSKEHLRAEAACHRLVEQRLLACGRFMTEEAATTDELRATLPQEVLPFFLVDVNGVRHIESVLYSVLRAFDGDSDVVLIALIYLARMIHVAKVPFTVRSAHRMLVGALLVASKVHREKVFSFHVLSARFNCSRRELARLELAALHALGFRTFVHPTEYIVMAFSMRSCFAQVVQNGEIKWVDVLQLLPMPTVSANACAHQQQESTGTRKGSVTHKLAADSTSVKTPSYHEASPDRNEFQFPYFPSPAQPFEDSCDANGASFAPSSTPSFTEVPFDDESYAYLMWHI